MQNQEQYDVIVKALQYLAGVCDFANQKDDQGFNAPDAWAGHFMAEKAMYFHLSVAEQCKAYAMLHKYSRQLSSAGIVLPTTFTDGYIGDNRRDDITKNKDLMKALGKAEPSKNTVERISDTHMKLHFPYDAVVLADMKTIVPERLRKYDGAKGWDIHASQLGKLKELFPNLVIDPEIPTDLPEPDQSEIQADIIRQTSIELVGDEIHITTDRRAKAEQDLIRSLPKRWWNPAPLLYWSVPAEYADKVDAMFCYTAINKSPEFQAKAEEIRKAKQQQAEVANARRSHVFGFPPPAPAAQVSPEPKQQKQTAAKPASSRFAIDL